MVTLSSPSIGDGLDTVNTSIGDGGENESKQSSPVAAAASSSTELQQLVLLQSTAVRLISIPRFSTTGLVVLVDISSSTFNTFTISFR